MFALTVLALGSYAVLTLLGRVSPRLAATRPQRARLVLALVFVNTGLAHFYDAAAMRELLPPFVPLPHATVLASGAFEIGAGLALLVPRLRRPAAWALTAFLVTAFPLNVYGALTQASVGGHEAGPAYLLVRGPFQAALLALTVAFGVRSGPAVGRAASRDGSLRAPTADSARTAPRGTGRVTGGTS